MHVGILGGTGPAGRGLAVRLAAAGVRVTLGSREAERAVGIAHEVTAKWPDLHLDIVGADNAGAARADVVVLATPWESAISTLKPLRDLLAEKVVISMANALVKEGREMLALIPPRGSVAAAVQAALPDSFVAAVVPSSAGVGNGRPGIGVGSGCARVFRPSSCRGGRPRS